MDTTEDLLKVKDSIISMSLDDALEAVELLYDKWILEIADSKKDIFEYLTLALENFGMSIDNLQLGSFDKARCIIVYKLSYLRNHFNNIENIEDEVKEEVVIKFNKIFRAIIDAENAIRYSLHLKDSMTETDIGRSDQLELFNYTPINTEDNKPKHDLLLFLLENLMRRGYRRYQGECYQKIYTPLGFDTHAWKKAFSLNDFIYNVVDKNIYYEMWKNLNSEKGMVKFAVEYLENHKGLEFEDISKDRHVFAFNNGIYVSSSWSDDIPEELGSGVGYNFTSGYVDEFIPYEGPGSKKIGSNIVACKYFPYDFDLLIIPRPEEKGYRYNDWFNIIIDKCPHFKSIMDYQEWDPEVQRWLCILLGRLTYQLSEIEEWQIITYLLGQAGSGKSTILTKIAKLFYEACDVGTISNNMETKFGLGALQNKLMLIGPEIKGNFSMEQSEFQSMISGEDIQIAAKFKTASTVVWKVPGILAGNEVPQYSDNAGSISRRLCVFMFNKKVKAGAGDTQLGKKLEKEIASILPACIRAYHQAVNRHGSSDIWSILPKYFRDSRDEMAATTNALINFLSSDSVKLGPKFYCKESVFIETFNQHCVDKNLGKIKWSKQYSLGPFDTYGLKIDKKRKKYPNDETGVMTNGNFIFGMDVIPKVKITNGGDASFDDEKDSKDQHDTNDTNDPTEDESKTDT